MAKTKVLIVEDDPDLTDILAYNLRQAGYEVIAARDGNEGLRQARLVLPDVILLDLMLPLVDGLEVCRRLRADPATADLLILMVTAKSEETDEIVGLTLGADDYVSKPFSVKVLMERIKALRRRRGEATQDKEVVTSQGIVVDRRRHQALAEGRLLDLTQSEFRLLETLLRQPGRAFNRNELIESALGQDSFVLERTIDVHIRSLRQKLGHHANLIETVRGVGYRFHEGA
jgi:two-component system phosphate regulon response regulator PhoB